MKNEAKTKKKHGGSQTGFRKDISKGSGPVFVVRAALGLNQQRMADKLGVSLSGIAKWEREGSGPKLGILKRELEKLAKKAGVEL